MPSNIAKIYKVPVLISLTLAVMLISISVARGPLAITYIAIGTILGTFLLDLDYIIHAYFFDNETEFARNLKHFLQDKDYKNAILYMHNNKHMLPEKTLNSVLFQVALAVLAYFIISSSGNMLIRAFVLSAYVNSMYRYAELYFNQHSPEQWFWVLKDKPTQDGLKIFGMALIGILIFLLATF